MGAGRSALQTASPSLCDSNEVLIFAVPPALRLVEHLSSCVELSKRKFSADAGDDAGWAQLSLRCPEAV